MIGAAANFGYMAIAGVSLGLSALLGDLRELLLAAGVGPETTARLVGNNGWRMLMLFGAAPALLTFLVYLFVPESHRWQQERDRCATSHWDTRDLIGVLLGAAAVIGMIFLLLSDLPVAVSLAWVRDRPGVVAPIVGARTAAQLKGSLDADDVTLPPEIRDALDDVSAPKSGYPETQRR